jgi:hypothetical protein
VEIDDEDGEIIIDDESLQSRYGMTKRDNPSPGFETQTYCPRASEMIS